MNVCVIGLGYIGLPLAAVLARAGHRVVGVDIRHEVVSSIRTGELNGLEPSLKSLVREMADSGRLAASGTASEGEVFVVAVPTPLARQNRADLSHVEEAVDSIAPHLAPGNLVVIESTVPVGTTERMARRLMGLRPDLPAVKGKSSIFMAHCPERVLPGKILDELVEVDRIVGGVDPESTEIAGAFYATFVKGSIHKADVRTAEMCKLVENASRDVSIAFANEVSMLCDRMGVDSANLVRLANRHPRVKIMEPGPGVGGHCIPVDPWFLVQSEPKETRLIRAARHVNETKTKWVLQRIRETVSGFKNPVVACLGLAYKPDVNDLRESPAVKIVRALCSRRDCEVRVVEPYVDALPPSLGRWGHCRLTPLGEAMDEASIVVLLTCHREFCDIPGSLPEGKVFINPNGQVFHGRTGKTIPGEA